MRRFLLVGLTALCGVAAFASVLPEPAEASASTRLATASPASAELPAPPLPALSIEIPASDRSGSKDRRHRARVRAPILLSALSRTPARTRYAARAGQGVVAAPSLPRPPPHPLPTR